MQKKLPFEWVKTIKKHMKKENIKELIEDAVQRFKNELVSTIEEIMVDNEDEKEAYVDVSELSQLMNLSKKTIRKYASENKLPSDKDVSGRLRFRKKDVDKFIKNIQSNKYGI